MKYTDVDTSLFAEVILINFVADIQRLLGRFISYLKGEEKSSCTVEFRTYNSRNLVVARY